MSLHRYDAAGAEATIRGHGDPSNNASITFGLRCRSHGTPCGGAILPNVAEIPGIDWSQPINCANYIAFHAPPKLV